MKAFAVIAGMVLSLVLYFSIGYIILPYVDKFLPDSGDNIGLLLSFVAYVPVMLFLGSISTGLIIEPEMEERSYLVLIFYSPGFYFVLFAILIGIAFIALDSLNSMFVNNRASAPASPGTYWACFVLPLILLLWLTASWAGVSLGYKIRSKISRDDEN
jgi:hypothetical protein